jgi:sulfide:quinone oxidoreductase
MTQSDRFSVLIAGGGVAALEAALALRELSDGDFRVELLAPEPGFWYRPVSVAEPFGRGEVLHLDLGRLADAAGAGLTLGALAAVDSDQHEARTSAGAVLSYDALLVACGAVPETAVPGALTFRGPADAERLRALVDELEGGDIPRLAFVVPRGAVWALPAYELALMTAARLATTAPGRVELTLATPEERPLELFGRSSSDTVRGLLDEAGITFLGGVGAVGVEDGELQLGPDGTIPADRAVALPRLKGQRIHGLPQTVEGFVPVDDHGCVYGTVAVFAAGDITNFPVKQGGLAAQQGVVAAEAIAVFGGVATIPRPFRPVLRGLLLTGTGPRYLRRDLSGGGEADWASETPIWWPPTKIAGRRLASLLGSLTGKESSWDVPPPGPGVAVEVALEARDVHRLSAARRTTPPEATAGGRTVGAVMETEPLVVSPETTLDRVAAEMRQRNTGSALVVDEDRLVGILTARDLLSAFAGDPRPAESRARHWMTAEPVFVGPLTTLPAAEALMAEYGIHHLPVVEDDRPVGMVALRDLAQAAHRGGSRPAVGLGF